ncbi:MAG: aminotransferase class III-fold pyridoxal phosphate-dependent enzyme, partial [Chitinophagaceae bacterium]|nr:aminotransferase class III-fold pyridoxal phosphate-dependent enzyme [Chitinophagaceae bacterium]
MNKTPLLTEGDVNLSPFRAEWIEGLDHETNELLQSDARYFLHQSLSTPCLNVIESAEGIYITDIQGKKYMDFHGNNVHQVGHRNPYVIEKVKAQLDQLPFCPRRYTNQPIIELANRLTGLMPAGLSRVLFCPGGTSAIGMALKLARVITGKTKVVSYVDSFHGASLDAIAAGGEAQFKKYMGEFPDTINIPAPDNYRLPEVSEATSLAAIESIFKETKDVGAFIAETVRNTDVQIPSYAYWKKIRALCNEYKVLLILDEIPIA